MTTRNFNNVCTVGTLTAPLASSATSATLNNFNSTPTIPFTATIDRNTATEEIVLVTALLAGTATLVRGYDGTAAQAHSAGALIEHTAGAIEYIEANRHVNATTSVHGSTGNVVGDQGSQTLFDKTLVSPVLQANVTSGDGSVAYIPPGAETKNLYSGIGSDGLTKFTVSSSGVVIGAGVNLTTLNSTVAGHTTTLASHTSSISTINGTDTTQNNRLTALEGKTSYGATSFTGKVTGTQLDLTNTGDASATTDGALVIGARTSLNTTIDNNEIIFRSNGVITGNVTTQQYVDARVNAPDSGWTNATYQNGWSTFSSSFPQARYRMLSNGQVEVQGTVTGGTLGAVPVFTLPAGYRPNKELIFMVVGNDAVARVDVTPAGQVRILSGSSAFWTSLNFTFYAEA